MANLWLRIKIWSKVALISLLIVYVILFTYKNAQQKVQFWYWFHHQPETNLLLLVLCAFFAGIIGTLLVRTTFRTMRQVRDIQHRSRVQRLDRDMTDLRDKAAKLQSKPAPAPARSPIETLEDRRTP